MSTRRGFLGLFAKAGGAAAIAPLAVAASARPASLPTGALPPIKDVAPTPYYYDKDGVLILVAPKGMRVEGDQPMLSIGTTETGTIPGRGDISLTAVGGTQLRVHGTGAQPDPALRLGPNKYNNSGLITFTNGAGGAASGASGLITITGGRNDRNEPVAVSVPAERAGRS